MSSLMDKAKTFLVDKVSALPKPEANIDDVDIKDVSRAGVTYNASVGIMNPYDHDLPICEVTYSLKSAGKLILSGSMADPGSIKEKATTKLEVPLMVPHNILATLVKDLFSDWDIDYELEIGLVIDLPIIGNFTIPLRSKGEIKLPTMKDFF